jgi:hydroxyacylglutathione hydrolase
MSVDEVRASMAGGALLVDCRPPAAHALNRVAGSVSIPSGSSFGTWLGWVVEPDRPLVLLLDAPDDWDDAIRQALRVGYEEVVGHLRGGFAAWIESGGDVAAGGGLTVDELATQVTRGGADAPLVIDVRQATEYAEGHVPGAWHLAAGSLPDRLDDLPRNRPIATICGSGYRASVAASLLRQAGFTDVAWVETGVPAWRAQGHAVVTGDARGSATSRREATGRKR